MDCGYVYTIVNWCICVECGQVSTTHAESARNSKPASLRALDACAPIFTDNDDHDDDNCDHIIGGQSSVDISPQMDVQSIEASME